MTGEPVQRLVQSGYQIDKNARQNSHHPCQRQPRSRAGAISAGELQLIRAVSGYGSQEGKRIDERRPHTRRGRKKATPVRLSPQQAQQLKSHPFTPQGRHDTLLMCLLLDHGLRAGEVARLQVADFDLEAGQLRFYRVKVNKEQTHRLSADTLRAAQAYFQMGDAPDEGGVLRASRKGGALLDHALSERAISGRVRTLRPPAAGP